MALRLPYPCVVVLVGPSGAGKTTWAEQQLRSGQVISSDHLRALVGESEDDQRAGKDAFDVLDLILERRLKRKLVTVVDTLGLDGKRRRDVITRAKRHNIPVYAIGFDTPADTCRARNKQRERPVPAKALDTQFRSWSAVKGALTNEEFDGVHEPTAVELVPPSVATAPVFLARQKEHPIPMQFGLQIPSYTWPGGAPEMAARLGDIVAAAEDAGFTSIWVMDHFLQIPPIGRQWQDMLESYTTLGFIAGRTRSASIGTLVTGVTYRNIAHLAKIVATLDVLSGGRAVCGIGAAWFKTEHDAYGWDFPPLNERYARLAGC